MLAPRERVLQAFQGVPIATREISSPFPLPLSMRRVVEITNLASSTGSSASVSFRAISCGILKLDFGKQCSTSDAGTCKPHTLSMSRSALAQSGMFYSLQVSFSCSQFPVISLHDPDETSEMLRTAFLPRQLILINATWSERCPFGKTCQHAEDKRRDSSAWMVQHDYQPISRSVQGRETRLYIKPTIVEFTGIPDSGVRLLDFAFAQEFTWRRLSPVKPNYEPQQPIPIAYVQTLKLISLVRKDEELPSFDCHVLRHLQLIALPGSTGVWNMKTLLQCPAGRTSYPVELHIGGPLDGSALPLWHDNLSPADAHVTYLRITGFCPMFLYQTNLTFVFSQLRNLSIDISWLPFQEESHGQINFMIISLDPAKFPQLKTLRCTVSKAGVDRFNGPLGYGTSLHLKLPDHMQEVAISYMITVAELTLECGGCKSITKLPVLSSCYNGTEGIWRRNTGSSTFYLAESRASVDPLADYLESISRS